jgi:hypothetical protein
MEWLEGTKQEDKCVAIYAYHLISWLNNEKSLRENIIMLLLAGCVWLLLQYSSLFIKWHPLFKTN